MGVQGAISHSLILLHPLLKTNRLSKLIQSTLVIVDSSVGGKMSTITSNSTITGEIHTKIDNWSAQSVHYYEKFHYYVIDYYERRLYHLIQYKNKKYYRFLKSSSIFASFVSTVASRNSGISHYSGQIVQTDCLF